MAIGLGATGHFDKSNKYTYFPPDETDVPWKTKAPWAKPAETPPDVNVDHANEELLEVLGWKKVEVIDQEIADVAENS